MTTVMVKLTEIVLILLAIILLPFYLLWMFIGHLADRHGQRRVRKHEPKTQVLRPPTMDA